MKKKMMMPYGGKEMKMEEKMEMKKGKPPMKKPAKKK